MHVTWVASGTLHSEHGVHEYLSGLVIEPLGQGLQAVESRWGTEPAGQAVHLEASAFGTSRPLQRVHVVDPTAATDAGAHGSQAPMTWLLGAWPAEHVGMLCRGLMHAVWVSLGLRLPHDVHGTTPPVLYVLRPHGSHVTLVSVATTSVPGGHGTHTDESKLGAIPRVWRVVSLPLKLHRVHDVGGEEAL